MKQGTTVHASCDPPSSSSCTEYVLIKRFYCSNTYGLGVFPWLPWLGYCTVEALKPKSALRVLHVCRVNHGHEREVCSPWRRVNCWMGPAFVRIVVHSTILKPKPTFPVGFKERTRGGDRHKHEPLMLLKATYANHFATTLLITIAYRTLSWIE